MIEESLRKYKSRILELKSEINHEACGNPLYLKLFLHFSIPKDHVHPLRYEKLSEINTVEKLFEYILEFNNTYSFKEGILYNLLSYIALTRTGLTEQEMHNLIKPHKTVSKILSVFKICMVCYDGYYFFSNDLFPRIILTKYTPVPKPLHLDIIEVLNKETLTLRNSDELLFHLYESGD